MDNDIDTSDVSDIDDNGVMETPIEKDNSYGKEVIKNIEKDSQDSKSENKIAVDDDYVRNVVMERIIKYIKMDDIIKKTQKSAREELKIVRELKGELETFLLQYLDKIGQDIIQIGKENKLKKSVSKRKATLNADIIEKSIYHVLKKDNLCATDEDRNNCVRSIMEEIDKRREVKTKIYLKRTTKRNKK